MDLEQQLAQPEIALPQQVQVVSDEEEVFNPVTGERLPQIDLTSCPAPLPAAPTQALGTPTTLFGGRKMKGGLLGYQTDADKNKLIEAYLIISDGLKDLNNFSLLNNAGVMVAYSTLSADEKKKQLKNISSIMNKFIKLVNNCTDYVKQYIDSKASSSGGRKKQRGGQLDFTKMYNTQGLIVDNNDPIDKASSYVNTADQIPQPFSSASSGTSSYTSGIEPQFLQDVLPVLSMAGGVKRKINKHK